MGNNRSGMFLPGNDSCSYHVKFGKSAAIKVSERKISTNDEGECCEERTVSYKLPKRTCKLCLTKTRRAGYDCYDKFIISLQDQVQNWSYNFQMVVQRAEGTGELMVSSSLLTMDGCSCFKVDLTRYPNTIITAEGGSSTVTSFNQYGIPDCANEKGLVVMELKEKGVDESPYVVTVAHYFASFSKTDTGLSMIANVGGDKDEAGNNRGLAIQVDGPVQHPSAALFRMFDQVQRTGRWTPSACSHCANGNPRQNMSHGGGESQDSDIDIDTDGAAVTHPSPTPSPSLRAATKAIFLLAE